MTICCTADCTWKAFLILCIQGTGRNFENGSGESSPEKRRTRRCHQQHPTCSQDEDCAPPLKLEKASCFDPASRIVADHTFSSWWQKRGSRCGLNDSCASWLIVVAGKNQSTNGPRFHLPEQRPSSVFLMKVSAQAPQAVGNVLRWALANLGAIQCESNELPSLKWYSRQVFKQ